MDGVNYQTLVMMVADAPHYEKMWNDECGMTNDFRQPPSGSQQPSPDEIEKWAAEALKTYQLEE